MDSFLHFIELLSLLLRKIGAYVGRLSNAWNPPSTLISDDHAAAIGLQWLLHPTLLAVPLFETILLLYQTNWLKVIDLYRIWTDNFRSFVLPWQIFWCARMLRDHRMLYHSKTIQSIHCKWLLSQRVIWHDWGDEKNASSKSAAAWSIFRLWCQTDRSLSGGDGAVCLWCNFSRSLSEKQSSKPGTDGETI